MIGKTNAVIVLLFLFCAVFIPAQSNPVQQNIEDEPAKSNRQKRTFDFGLLGSRDWSQYRPTWRMPSIPLVSNLFDDDHESFKKRLADLENGQIRIINYLRKMKVDANASPCDRDSSTQQPDHPSTPDIVKPIEVAPNVTKVPVQTTDSTTTSNVTVADSATKAAKEQQIASNVTVDDSVTKAPTDQQTASNVTVADSSAKALEEQPTASTAEPLDALTPEYTTVPNVAIDSTTEISGQSGVDTNIEALDIRMNNSTIPSKDNDDVTIAGVDDSEETNDVFV